MFPDKVAVQVRLVSFCLIRRRATGIRAAGLHKPQRPVDARAADAHVDSSSLGLCNALKLPLPAQVRLKLRKERSIYRLSVWSQGN
jgi:hypothetical protein